MDDTQLIAAQRASAQYGVVTHERGLEILDTSGWILFGGSYVCIFPDNTQLATDQPRVVVPFARVVVMSLEGDS